VGLVLRSFLFCSRHSPSNERFGLTFALSASSRRQQWVIPRASDRVLRGMHPGMPGFQLLSACNDGMSIVPSLSRAPQTIMAPSSEAPCTSAMGRTSPWTTSSADTTPLAFLVAASSSRARARSLRLTRPSSSSTRPPREVCLPLFHHSAATFASAITASWLASGIDRTLDLRRTKCSEPGCGRLGHNINDHSKMRWHTEHKAQGEGREVNPDHPEEITSRFSQGGRSPALCRSFVLMGEEDRSVEDSDRHGNQFELRIPMRPPQGSHRVTTFH